MRGVAALAGVEAEPLGHAARPAGDPERAAVGLDDHRAVPIGPVHVGAGLVEPPQRLRPWVVERIARPGGDDGDARPGRLEERRGAAEAAAVMRDLEHERGERLLPREQVPLRARGDVAGEEERDVLPVEPEHERRVVLASRTIARAWRVQHGEPRVAEHDALAALERPARHAGPRDGSECVLAARLPAPVLPHLADAEATHDRGDAAGVIRIGVGDRDHVEPAQRPVPEERRHHALAHVESARSAGPSVDQHPRSARHLDVRRVALADVEEDDAQAPVLRAHPRPEGEPERHRGETGNADADGAMPGDERRQRERGVPRADLEPRRRRQVDHRARDPGRRPHDAPERGHHQPREVEDRRRGHLADQRDAEREEPERRARGGERDHDQVRRDPGERELVEVRQHHRRDRELGAEAHRGSLPEPPRPAPRGEALGERRSQVHDARGRDERQREAGLAEIAGPPGQHDQPGQGERVHELGLAVEQDADEQCQAHDRGAQHRRLPPDHQREAEQHQPGRHRGRPPWQTGECEPGEDRGGEQGHVEARHGQHVVDAGPAEALVHLARDPGAVAEHEPGEERRRALGQVRADRRNRPALHPHGPGRRVGGEQPDAVPAAAADEQDALAAEVLGVVEPARVAEAARRMQAELRLDPLPLADGGALAVDRRLDAPGRRPPVRTLDERADVEDDAGAIRRPADRLLGEPALDDRLRAARPEQRRDVRFSRRMDRGAPLAERRHRGEQQHGADPLPAERGEQRGEREQRGRRSERVGRGPWTPRRHRDAGGERGGQGHEGRPRQQRAHAATPRPRERRPRRHSEARWW